MSNALSTAANTKINTATSLRKMIIILDENVEVDIKNTTGELRELADQSGMDDLLNEYGQQINDYINFKRKELIKKAKEKLANL